MKLVLAVAALAGILLAGSALDGRNTPVAQAAVVTIDVTAVGAQENPPVTSEGYAIGRFTYDSATKVLTYAVTVNGLSSGLVTSSHIHRGATGVNGPIVYTLSAVGFTQIAGSITLTADDVADLEAGRLYFNIHSTANPGGAARGQILLPKAGAAITPPSTGDAGLSGSSGASLLPLAGLVLAFGAGSLALARRHA